MIEQIEAIEQEQVDDIPLLLAVIKQMGLIEIFNEQIEQHGNWEGVAAGYIIAVWLAYIVSQGDHRKCYLQEWVAKRSHTLLHSLDVAEIHELDFTDDRLGLILNKLSHDEVWQKSEQAVNERVLQVYSLTKPETVRVDTTTVSSYGRVTADGLVQFGYSKDHRPDLGQVKIASATLDPLGMPLVTVPVSGEQADDSLYLPVIRQVRQSLPGRSGLLYVGDSKMGAIGIRAELAAAGDYYLMPLSQVQLSAAELAGYLDQFSAWPTEAQQLEQVIISDEKGEKQLIAEGFTLEVELTADHQGPEQPWRERRLVVLSANYAKKERAKLDQRLLQAEAALAKVVQRRQGYQYPQSEEEVAARVARILTAHDCHDYLHVDISQTIQRRQIRAYLDRPAREEITITFHIHSQRQEEALAQAYRLLGWRVYVTNAPVERLSLTLAVEVYRDAYLHEHGYSRLKGKPLALSPLYLQKDDQIIGLIRLLSLALRVLTLIEFLVRRQLAAEASRLKGIYAGNRNRQTKSPRAETLLQVFKGIMLTLIYIQGQEWVYLTPLTPTQKRILQLLGLPEAVYSCLVPESAKVVLKSAN